MGKKFVYFYGGGKKMTEGNRNMRDLLGGKGANLAEMAGAGVPVPPGFTISTEACAAYETNGSYPKEMMQQVKQQLTQLEKLEGKKLGDAKNPLLVSVRSGAAQFDARHDGYGAESWNERQVSARLYQHDGKRESRLGLLPSLYRHVR